MRARRSLIIPATPAAPSAGNVGLRFINAAAGLANLDFNVIRKGTDTLPDLPMRGNVAFGTAATYAAVKADSMQLFHPRAGVDSIVFYDTPPGVGTAVGTKTPVLFATGLPLG